MVNLNYPENVFRFCPRCGSSEFKPDSTKSFKCPKCGFHYFINPVAAVTAMIFDTDGLLLLTRRRHAPAEGMLDLPGGFIDKGEKAEEALLREIKEELNLHINHSDFYGTFPNEYVFENIVYFTLDIVFICKVSDFSKLEPADDVVSCEFISPEKINLNEIGLDSVKNIIRTYLTSNKTYFHKH
ncbi:MAG: NUDIX domain-containing protein [Bacteroidales bacterium]